MWAQIPLHGDCTGQFQHPPGVEGLVPPMSSVILIMVIRLHQEGNILNKIDAASSNFCY